MENIHVLKMVDICKSFNCIQANKNINLEIRAGEVLGLLGENGAGKTTLMNILYGLYNPDSGSILINGVPVKIRSPRDSSRFGIGMIHQHFMLVQNHTVTENLILGHESAAFFNPHKKLVQEIEKLNELYGLKVDPHKKVWELSAGEQQKVEIMKAVFQNADLLIMDEPTSVLTPGEVSELFGIINKMKEDNHSVILISHKLDEIMKICDRVTVLRKGSTVGEASINDVDKKKLARMMVGRDVVFSFSRKKMKPGRKVLEVKNLTVRNDRGLDAVKNISFTIHKNEILGIAGVSGNGQQELAEALTGLKKPVSGKILLGDNDITGMKADAISSRGISHIPEERIKYGIVPNLVIFENSILKQHGTEKFSSRLFMNYKKIREYTGKLLEKYQVVSRGISQKIKDLSGGNIQKLIIGREIEAKPSVLVAAHPTYGLDVGATEYVRNQLLKTREEGGAVLLVSEDLDELFELCDRIAVIFNGRFTGILDHENADTANIGMLMSGADAGDKHNRETSE